MSIRRAARQRSTLSATATKTPRVRHRHENPGFHLIVLKVAQRILACGLRRAPMRLSDKLHFPCTSVSFLIILFVTASSNKCSSPTIKCYVAEKFRLHGI